MARLLTKTGFDWDRVAWTRAERPPRGCAYCARDVDLDGDFLELWGPDGNARFCAECTAQWFDPACDTLH